MVGTPSTHAHTHTHSLWFPLSSFEPESDAPIGATSPWKDHIVRFNDTGPAATVADKSGGPGSVGAAYAAYAACATVFSLIQIPPLE